MTLGDVWNDEIIPRATDIVARAIELSARDGFRMTVVESCTGGLLSGALTSVSGVSAVYQGGFVTYSNEAKIRVIKVNPGTIATRGAVSEECAREMAFGALWQMDAHVAVSVTGIAGPDGGTPEKPVGTVWFGGAFRDGRMQATLKNFGLHARDEIRIASVKTALDMLLSMIKEY